MNNELIKNSKILINSITECGTERLSTTPEYSAWKYFMALAINILNNTDWKYHFDIKQFNEHIEQTNSCAMLKLEGEEMVGPGYLYIDLGEFLMSVESEIEEQ